MIKVIMYIENGVASFLTNRKINFVMSLTFANIVIMVLELKNYSINIVIRDVWKLKDNK